MNYKDIDEDLIPTKCNNCGSTVYKGEFGKNDCINCAFKVTCEICGGESENEVCKSCAEAKTVGEIK